MARSASAHRQVHAHDLRASFITVAVANGRSETWVIDRTGHTTSGELLNYRRAARTVAGSPRGLLRSPERGHPRAPAS